MISADRQIVPPIAPPILPVAHGEVATDLRLATPGDPERIRAAAFVGRVFALTHGAHIDAWLPYQLIRRGAPGIRWVAGVRPAGEGGLFLEHYLDAPVQHLIGSGVTRAEVVEVGNLALARPGEARQAIALVTAFLETAGFSWVAFTASTPVFNAFRRLGLAPRVVAEARPGRLPDRGACWGSYFMGRPRVCVGAIHGGFSLLSVLAAADPDGLGRAWEEAQRLGRAFRSRRGGYQ